MSLVEQYHNDHKAIHQRIAAKAAEHAARKRAAMVAELQECCAPKPKPEPIQEPEPIKDGWAEQQIGKYGRHWFSIVSAIKVAKSGAPTMKSIQRVTCEVYGVKLIDLLSARRTGDIMRPRMVSIYLAKELTGLSWIRIGKATGGRDHSTAMHAHRKIQREIKSNEKLANAVALIRERLS